MSTMIPTFLSQIWTGIWSIPVFDLGINFGQLSLGCMVITISFILFRSTFSLASGISSRIGRNVRNNRYKNDRNKRNEIYRNNRFKNSNKGVSE